MDKYLKVLEQEGPDQSNADDQALFAFRDRLREVTKDPSGDGVSGSTMF